jgi:selenocysteine lyase/cysteine desulfurase
MGHACLWMLHGLAQIAGLKIYGIKDPDSPGFAQKGGVIVFSLKEIMANRVAKELAERGGIGVRSGCHCAHMLVKHLVNVSPQLERFQGLMLTLLPQINLPGLVRVSLGIGNSKEDADSLIRVLGNIARQPRTPGHRNIASADDGTPILPHKDVKQPGFNVIGTDISNDMLEIAKKT